MKDFDIKKIRTSIVGAVIVIMVLIGSYFIIQTAHSAYISWKEAKLVQEAKDLYDSLKAETPTQTPTPAPTQTPLPDIPVKPEAPNAKELEIRPEFKALMEQYNNYDIVGYLKIEGTTIDYPILQSTDNDFYLNRDINKNTSSAGSIYLDYENDITKPDRNIIMYGHNMKQNIMFHGLRFFQQEDYYKEHKYISFSTLYEDYLFEIFAAYVTHVSFNYIMVNFPTDEYFTSMVDKMVEKSLYDTGVEVDLDDRILTLSTCSNVDPNTRIVVNAKLIEVDGRAYTDILAEQRAYEKALEEYEKSLTSLGISTYYMPKEELSSRIEQNRVLFEQAALELEGISEESKQATIEALDAYEKTVESLSEEEYIKQVESLVEHINNLEAELKKIIEEKGE